MKARYKKSLIWYLLLFIPILGTIVFNIYPLLDTFILSLKNSEGHFIKLVNYQLLFSDKLFTQSIWNTLFMAIFGVGFTIIISFAVANILNNIPFGKGLFKIVFLLPLILSMVTVANMFKYLLAPDEAGILNYILKIFNVGPFAFFNDPSLSRQSIVALALWKGVGYNVILFLVGLQNIPTELYEAADIDGANEWKKWTHITIPCMRGTFVFVFITATIGALKRFAEVFAISGDTGNPANSLSTIMTYIYKNSFSTLNINDIGRASSASVVLFALTMIFTLINFAVTRDKDTVKEQRLQKRLIKEKKAKERMLRNAK